MERSVAEIFFSKNECYREKIFTNHKMANKSAKNHHLKASQCWKWHLVNFGGGFPKLQLAGLVQGAGWECCEEQPGESSLPSCSPCRPVALLFMELHFCFLNLSCFSPFLPHCLALGTSISFWTARNWMSWVQSPTKPTSLKWMQLSILTGERGLRVWVGSLSFGSTWTGSFTSAVLFGFCLCTTLPFQWLSVGGVQVCGMLMVISKSQCAHAQNKVF